MVFECIVGSDYYGPPSQKEKAGHHPAWPTSITYLITLLALLCLLNKWTATAL